MIASLSGRIIKKSLNSIVVDVGGVGYQVFLPLSTYYMLPDDSETVDLLIYTHVRENEISLYGFLTEEEREVFLDLIGVSGIGTKIATAILSGISPAELKDAVLTSDTIRLMAIPGVGKKAAERIPLDLREKFEKRAKKEGVSKADKDGLVVSDIIDALVNLGYTRSVAEKAVREAMTSGEKDIGEILKGSLKILGKGIT
jgi:Holliday junction DNA helicase RuvA